MVEVVTRVKVGSEGLFVRNGGAQEQTFSFPKYPFYLM